MLISKTCLLLCGAALLSFGSLAHAADSETVEVAKISGTYQLSKATLGTCPATIKVEPANFATTTTVGLSIYGAQPGDVVIQLDSLNSGKATQRLENPMSGAFMGTESAESQIGDGQITGYSENQSESGKSRFRYDFSATYSGNALSYEVKYVGAMNGICFDDACEYHR
jgi:hypothetical protein